VILKMTRAIAGAQRLLHRDMPEAIEALRNAGITAPTSKHLETIANLYRPAVPKTPHVSAAAVERTRRFTRHVQPCRTSRGCAPRISSRRHSPNRRPGRKPRNRASN
jgi:hypothetical protein